MEAIMIWAKENYDLICLLVGVIGVLISIIGVVYEIKKKKTQGQVTFVNSPFIEMNKP